MDLTKYDVYRPAGYNVWMRLIFLQHWPSIADYLNKFRVIYAGAGDHSFYHRPTDSIIEEVKDFYHSGVRTFFFENLSEGVMISDLDKLNDICGSAMHLPDIKFFYICGDYNAEISVNKHFSDKKIYFRTIGVSHFEWAGHNFLPYEKPYVTGIRQKKFLCFNRVPRQHRIDLLNNIVERGLLDQSFYSFDTIDEEALKIIRNVKPLNGIDQIRHRFPLVLNRNIERDNPTNIIEDDFNYFEDSYFSVIPETMFYDPVTDLPNGAGYHILNTYPGNFLSEKTYKSIRMKHPFIMVGPHRSLEFLKSRGYKTFSPFIDESYDLVEDSFLRMQMITDEIERLCNLSEQELFDFTVFAKNIVEHNYNVLASVNNFNTLNDLGSILNI